MEGRSKTVGVDLQANILNFNTIQTVTYKETTPKMGLLFYVYYLKIKLHGHGCVHLQAAVPLPGSVHSSSSPGLRR